MLGGSQSQPAAPSLRVVTGRQWRTTTLEMPRRSTVGDGSSSYLRRAWEMRSAICGKWSEWELRKAGHPMTISMGVSWDRMMDKGASL